MAHVFTGKEFEEHQKLLDEIESMNTDNINCLLKNGFINPGKDLEYFVKGNFYVKLDFNKGIKSYGINYLLHFNSSDKNLNDELLHSYVDQARSNLNAIMFKLQNLDLPNNDSWDGHVIYKSREFIQRIEIDGFRFSITKNKIGKTRSIKLERHPNFVLRLNKEINPKLIQYEFVNELKNFFSLLPTFS